VFCFLLINSLFYHLKKKRVVINYKNKVNGFMPTTHIPHFSSEDGKHDLPKEIFLLPSFNWTWVNDWTIVSDSANGTEEVRSVYLKTFFFK